LKAQVEIPLFGEASIRSEVGKARGRSGVAKHC
jgi:hypothetical protein